MSDKLRFPKISGELLLDGDLLFASGRGSKGDFTKDISSCSRSEVADSQRMHLLDGF